MDEDAKTLNVAIVGGGQGCLAVMDYLSGKHVSRPRMRLVGSTDIDPGAPALSRARAAGISVYHDFHEFFRIRDLDLIIDLTGDPAVCSAIQAEKPAHVQLLEHKSARLFRDFMQLEDAARRARKTAEGIIYGSPIPMFVLDGDHRITYWNKAVEKLTGFRGEDMIGTDRQWMPFYPRKRPLLADLLIDGDMDRVRKMYRHMNLRKSSLVEGAYEVEYFFPHLGREGTHLYLNATPIRDDAGTIQGAIVTYQDFSERVRMIHEIRNRENFVQNLIQNSIDGIIATDHRGKITIFNRGASEILGYRPEEIIGRMSYRDLLSEETASMIKESFYGRRHGPPGKIINLTTRLINQAEEAIPVRLSGALLYEGERELGSVVFVQDLREIRKLRKEKEQAQRMAAIGRTVAGVAHYIKNILNGIRGGAYIVDSALNREDIGLAKKGWDMVDRNIRQIWHIVMDMLIYSTDKTPSYEMVDPNELAREVLELMEERARLSGVQLMSLLRPGIPLVAMDRTAIHRCLLNLVGNAVDACTLEGLVNGKGVVTVKTDRVPGRGIRFRVIDNGTGMDKDTQKRLFTDFFTTKGYRGTGLGLPVTRKIVKEHGGELTFRSREGEGTTFTLILPEKTV